MGFGLPIGSIRMYAAQQRVSHVFGERWPSLKHAQSVHRMIAAFIR